MTNVSFKSFVKTMFLQSLFSKQTIKLLLFIAFVYTLWKPLWTLLLFVFTNFFIILYQVAVLSAFVVAPIVMTGWMLRFVCCTFCCCRFQEGMQATKSFFYAWLILGITIAFFLSLFIYLESDGWKNFENLNRFTTEKSSIFDENEIFNSTIFEL